MTVDGFKFACVIYGRPLSVKCIFFKFNISGWGTLKERGESTRKLQRVEVPHVPFEKCRKEYQNLGFIAAKVRKGMLCAGK